MSQSIVASPRPSSVPDNVLRQLAKLARVPAKQREFFFDEVRMHVQTACELNGLVKQGLATKRSKTLARAATDLYDTLGSLGNREGALINGILSKGGFVFGKISNGGVTGLKEIAYQIALLSSLVTGKPRPRYPHQSPQQRKRGRKSGGVKNWIFQNFVFDLLISTATANGKLTLEKNGAFGTLIDALDMLAPHLPDGFVPQPLPASTFQRLKTRCERIRDDLADQN